MFNLEWSERDWQKTWDFERIKNSSFSQLELDLESGQSGTETIGEWLTEIV